MKSNSLMELDACYFCTTPFQMIGAIQLVRARNENADLYIIPQFENANIYASRIEKLNLFFRVKVLDDKKIMNDILKCKNPIIKRFLIAYSYLSIEEIIKEILFPNTLYKTMYITNRTYCSRVVQLYFQKNHFLVDISYYDDGSASYVDHDWHFPSILDNICRLFICNVIEKEKDILSRKKYLFSPTMYAMINKTIENVLEIPFDGSDSTIKEILYYVFGKSEKLHFLQNVLILDTSRQDFSCEAIQRLDSCYMDIVRVFGKGQVVIKPHPRNNSSMPQVDCTVLDDVSVPFELFIINNDFSSKVLIALESTAVAMPKILYDQEPIIILLYRVVQARSGQRETDNYFQALKVLYRDRNKVFIPNTVDELNSVLRLVHEIICR